MSITNVHGVGQLPFAAKALFGAPRCPSANGIGYVPGAGNIYIISGSNTGFIESAQDRTWAYEPVANSWTDLTATVSFPHPAGGFAYGVINNKVTYLEVATLITITLISLGIRSLSSSLHGKGQQAGYSAKRPG